MFITLACIVKWNFSKKKKKSCVFGGNDQIVRHKFYIECLLPTIYCFSFYFIDGNLLLLLFWAIFCLLCLSMFCGIQLWRGHFTHFHLFNLFYVQIHFIYWIWLLDGFLLMFIFLFLFLGVNNFVFFFVCVLRLDK